LVVEVTAQPIKPTRMQLRYPCIIYSSSKHRAPDCPKKPKVQNMLWIKLTTTTNVLVKNPIPDNVLVNIVVAIMTCSKYQTNYF